MMNRRKAIILATALVVVGITTAFFSVKRQVTLVVDGQARKMETYGLTVADALHEVGLGVTSADQVAPATGQWLGFQTVVEVKTAKVVSFWYETGETKSIRSIERKPEAWAQQAGITFNAGDIFMINGKATLPGQALEVKSGYVVQILPRREVTVSEGGQTLLIQTTAASMGQALWKAGLQLSQTDTISAAFMALVKDTPNITLQRGKTMRFIADGKEISARTGAIIVGQALVEVGLSLQGFDYSQPAEDKPVPADGLIRIIRVTEMVELKQTPIAYKSELVADPELELDQRRIVQAGREGLKVARIVVRYEDGKEIKRLTEAEWTASEPQTQKTGYGTKIVLRTLDTADGPIQYWRSARVYATSYGPCDAFKITGRCNYTTANGSRLQKGIVGMGETWYRLMVNQGVYVEGYGKGVVADYGYVPGFWVDLGYDLADYVAWHSQVTLYWLTPVPAAIPWILPP